MKLPMAQMGDMRAEETAVPSAAMSGAEPFPEPSCPACGGQHKLRDCPVAKERSFLRAEISLADMLFEPAAKKWLATRSVGNGTPTEVRYIEDGSVRTYSDYIWALSKFFGDTVLRDIDDGMIRVFQDCRAVNKNNLWIKKCGQNHLRKEVHFLKMVMRSAGVWTEELDEAFEMLPVEPSKVPYVPEPIVREKVFRIMASKDEWLWIYHYANFVRLTTASTFEMRMARLDCMDLRRRLFHVRKGQDKCRGRIRAIPLETDDILESGEWLLRRAHRLGAHEANHFLFPWGVGSKYEVDPTQPMERHAMKNSINRIKKRAGVPLRPNHFRHWAMTEMAERGEGIHAIMAFAGHLDKETQQHYIHISDAAKRAIAARQNLPSAFEERKGPRRVEEWEMRVRTA